MNRRDANLLLGQSRHGSPVRHDHGSAFVAKDLQNQTRARGMLPGCAFVAQPETSGVIERFVRTLREQMVPGRVFRTTDDFRDAARDFVLGYDAEWPVGKNGYPGPAIARQRGLDHNPPCAAYCNLLSREPGAVRRTVRSLIRLCRSDRKTGLSGRGE